MKKRIACVLLTLIMLVSLVPVTALTASAASFSVSNDMVDVIKEFEGFREKAYQDGSQWSIGYGTVSKEGETITREKAEEALREELEKVADTLNDFIDAWGLTHIKQNKFDALASFSYNCGTGWMSANGVFRQAVIGNKTGNEFLNAISLWANVGSVPNAGLLNRRMAEAATYLNGTYSAQKPDSYTYVIYNANGGSVGENKMQGYIVSEAGVDINASAVRNGYRFKGWYTEDGTYVSKLNKDTAGKTLVARWNALVTVTNDYINVREEAGADPTHSIVGKVYFGDVLEILEVTETSNGQLWGRFEDGWVALQYTDYKGEAAEEEEDEDEDKDTDSEDKTEEKVIATGTVVNCTNLNIRQHSAAYYPKVGSLAAGTKVSIYEIEDNWGRIDKGWISLQYVALDKEIEEDDKTDSDDKDDNKDNSSSETVIATGTVNSYTNLNIRQHAGASYPKVGSLPTGTKVEIYETTTNNGVKWGRIDEGWICMTYITLDTTSSGNVNGTPIGTGTVVNCSTAVNIRAAAGTHNALVGTAALGSTVNIYEVTTYNKVEWGRTDKGWVCMQYIQMNTGTAGGTTGGTTGGSTSATNGGFEASNVLSNLNAIASEEVVVYDASGAKTTTTIKKGSSFTVTALGLFSKGKDIDAETTMAQCSLGYVEAEKLVMTAPSATYYSAVEMQYKDTDGAEKYIQIGEALTITEVEARGKDTIAYAEEHDVGVYAEYLLISRTNDMYTVTSDATVYMYDEDSKELFATTMVAYRDSNLYITGFKTIDGVSYGYIEEGIEVSADVYEDAYIEASKLKSLVTGATGGTGSTGSSSGNTSTGGSTSGSTDSGVQTGVIANADSVNVRSSAGVSYTNKVGSVTRGTKVTIYETTTVNGALWGRIGENRWVAMQYVVLDTTSGGSNTGTNNGTNTGTSTGTSDVATGIVKTNNLNVRSGPGLGYGKVGSLSLGSTVNVYEQQLKDGMIWGRIGTNRWVCLSYVTLTSTGTSESTGTGVMGTIARCFYAVNVRSAPGTGNALIGQILVGSRVEIFEQKLYGTQYWGRVAQGWICMDYVLLDSELPGGTIPGTGNDSSTGNTNTNTGTGGSINTGTVAPVSTVATGKVDNAAGSTFTTVYEDAAATKIADTVAEDASVSISELKVNGSSVMGKISAGWIDMANVDMTAYANASKEIDIYSTAGGAESGTTMAAGESVEIVAVTAVGADVWCQTKFGGFVKMSDITLSTSASCNTSTSTNTNTSTGTNTNTNVSTNTSTTVTTGAQTYTGTVIGTNSLKVRGTPSMNGTVGTTLKLGTPVMIYETAIADYLAWGRCDAGWICLVYVDLVPYSSGAQDARVVQTDGTVIYSEAGGGETVGTYPKCTVVDIYEISGNWGRTADGWVSFNDLLA